MQPFISKIINGKAIGLTNMTKTEGNRIAPWNDPQVKWVCEDHPTEEQGHKVGWWVFKKECGGAGMPEPTEENKIKGYLN